MTAEEQDAVLGRLMREKRDAESHRAALEAEAYRIGDRLNSLGSSLKKHLHEIYLEGTGLDTESVTSPVWVKESEKESINKALGLANDYRETIKTIKRISRQLSEAGWK